MTPIDEYEFLEKKLLHEVSERTAEAIRTRMDYIFYKLLSAEERVQLNNSPSNTDLEIVLGHSDY